MPHPKYPLGKKRSSADRQFTDREEFVGAFERIISDLPLEKQKILAYYGVGGIGKTRLLKELCQQLEEGRKEIAWAVLDFATKTHRDVEGGLSWLRRELARKYKVQFPSYEMARLQFLQKSRPNTPLQREELPWLGEDVAETISILEDIPIVGLAPKAFRIVKKSHEWFKDWSTTRDRPELGDLQDMMPNEIAERLPMFWAADLKDFMQRESRPVVLFIDTYEALWEEGRTEGSPSSRDEWVRELVTHLREVPWIIAGQWRLRWEEEVDPDWGSCLEQHLVGQLAENDSRRFLASCEIAEGAVQEAIVEGSEGVPYYLDLAVDTYRKIKDEQRREPVPMDFGRTPPKVRERFLRYLNQAEKETLNVLSVPRFFDRELFELLIEKFKTGYPATALDDLCRFSFVQERQVPGTWTIHPLMRESLEEYLSEKLRERVHNYLFYYYDASLKELESRTIGDPTKTALAEAFYHGEHVLPPEEFSEWFANVKDVFERAALWYFLQPLYERFAKLMEDRLGPEDPLTATGLNNLASLYHQQGRYAEAEPLHEHALAIREETLGPEHQGTATSLNNLASLLQDQGEYAEAHPLYERALAINEKTLGAEHPDTAQILNNLALLLRDQGEYAEAQPLYERALVIREKALGDEHPDTAQSLANLAMLLVDQGEYAEARPLYERALAINEKAMGTEHPSTATGLSNLALLLRDQGSYAEARPLYERALAIREEALGPEHPDTALSLNNLASLLANQAKYAEARPLYERALAINERALGAEHPATAKPQQPGFCPTKPRRIHGGTSLRRACAGH